MSCRHAYVQAREEGMSVCLAGRHAYVQAREEGMSVCLAGMHMCRLGKKVCLYVLQACICAG